MKAKIITAIAFNTLGAAIIAIGAGLPDRIAAIAVSSFGCSVSVMGVCSAIASDSKEVIQARKESLYWAQEAQTHLLEKRELLAQFQELNDRVRSAEAQYAITISHMEVDEEWIENMEKAELN